MANNQYNSKVELSDGTVLMDLTSDTVTPGSMVMGTTAHDRSGAAITGSLGPATQSSDGLMSSQDKTKLDGISDGFSGSYVPEAGRILPYGGTTAPPGYLLCDGAAYSREDYSELFAVIGTTFGSGDGSTTFNVPDLRGRTSIGANASHLMGTTGGEESHTHTYGLRYAGFYRDTILEGEASTGLHHHQADNTWSLSPSGASVSGETVSVNGGNTTSTRSQSSVAHYDMRADASYSSSMPPYQVVNYIISTGKLGYAGIKGDKGDTGDTGAAAGFGTPTATVDSNVGTPSVTVTASGPDTAKVFEFEFENMKGEKGDRGEPITVDDFVPVAAGLIYPYAGSTAPTGYLMCDGAAVSRTTYADLFEAIGTTYGAGDGSTTFNVPDLRGRVPLGSSSTHALGSTGGSETVTLTKDQSGLPKHGHGFTQPTVNGGATTTTSKTLTGWTAMYQDTGMFDPGNSYRSGIITIGGQRSSSYRPGWTSGTSRDMNISASHDHPQVAHTHSVSGGAVSDNNGANASQAHNNMQPYQTTNYIISTGIEYGGLRGATGEAAGFGTPTATVDANVGTPSVTVTASGPDTAKVFDFEFENLKGETGPQGPQGIQGPKGDTGDMASGFYVGTTEPQGSSYFFWYNPLNGAVKVKQYVEPDAYTDGGWAWREMVFADIGKNGDVYTATADELEEAVPAN